MTLLAIQTGKGRVRYIPSKIEDADLNNIWGAGYGTMIYKQICSWIRKKNLPVSFYYVNCAIVLIFIIYMTYL